MGQEVILPVEVSLDALRVTRQNELSAIGYHHLMFDRLNVASNDRNEGFR
jgi:hypothetical protein